jgi:2-C-methyl-D-erythritol 4-phosphate cytidylyltransferase
MNYYVIIAAGGIGTRMQSNIPKQYLLIHNKPVLYHTVSKFKNTIPNINCIVVVPYQFIDDTKNILLQHNIDQNCTVIAGGLTRFHSVQNGVNAIQDNNAIVMVHDAARCLVTEQLIHNCVQQTLLIGNAVPAIAVTDSLRVVKHNNENSIVDRTTIRSIQTPQCFELSILQKAFAADFNDSFTDEASVVEQLGIAIHLIDGEATNIKITNPIDIVIAEKIMNI